MNSFLLLGVFTPVPIEMWPWECAQTNRYTDICTDRNWFYNLSHAICYSYETDNYQNSMLVRHSAIKPATQHCTVSKTCSRIAAL